VYRGLVGEPEGKRTLVGTRHRWEVNIKMDLQEVELGCGDWMKLVQDMDRRWRALVSAVMNLRVHKIVGNFLNSCKDWLASQEGVSECIEIT
jgi:hypothetical protein